MDYDKTNMPRGYDRGRGYTTAQLAHWLAVISRSVEKDRVGKILDLGCGTGRYSSALGERFGAFVLAVDPAEKMLLEARAKRRRELISARACGESLPLARASVDMVFMSMVFHHFNDPRRVVRECHRVLRRRGSVCLRAGTVEQVDNYAYVPFFPGTRLLLERTLNPWAFIQATFADGGLELVHHELVPSEAANNWVEYAERLGYRADSILVQLPDREFEQGLEAVRSYAEAAPPHEPVVEPVDFFVFRSV